MNKIKSFFSEKLAPFFKKLFRRAADDMKSYHIYYLRTLCGVLALVLVLSVSSAISMRTARADALMYENKKNRKAKRTTLCDTPAIFSGSNALYLVT